MPAPYSQDLRQRVIGFMALGGSARAAARRFEPGFARWIEAILTKGLESIGKTWIPTFIRYPATFSPVRNRQAIDINRESASNSRKHKTVWGIRVEVSISSAF